MRRYWRFLALLAVLPLLLTIHPATAVSFNSNWTGTPSAPLAWTPGSVNDWDLLTNIDYPTDLNGIQQAVHGPACEAPPATHQISNLDDSAFICNNHLMTAINGGGDAAKTYGAVYFTPSQLMDWSGDFSSLSWKVSTQVMSTRDWWQVDLTPFAENMVTPLAPWLPAYNGYAKDELNIQLGNGYCQGNQPSGIGPTIGITSVANFAATNLPTSGCMYDAGILSAAVRSQFQVDLTPSHLKVFMPGTSLVFYDGPLALPFSKSVVQFSHHSYNPTKDQPTNQNVPGLPGTWHWSDISISNSQPFTMLRASMPHSLHDGGSTVATLSQPAPADSFLRFLGYGGGSNTIRVSLNGGAPITPSRQQQAGSYGDGNASYWMPIPAGTTSFDFAASLSPAFSNYPWWVEDVSVWSLSQPAPAPAPTPSATINPTPTPQQMTNLPCVVTCPVPQGQQVGHCTGTFTQP